MMKRLLVTSLLVLISAWTVVAQGSALADQITEVTLERTACFGTCPMYKVTVRRDGTLIYEGKRFVPMMGTYKGTAYGFDRLAEFILAQDYFNLNDDYSSNVTDLPSAITSVVRNGQRKTIRNYGGAGPIGLWGVEMAIDGMVQHAKLQKVALQPARPRAR